MSLGCLNLSEQSPLFNLQLYIITCQKHICLYNCPQAQKRRKSKFTTLILSSHCDDILAFLQYEIFWINEN